MPRKSQYCLAMYIMFWSSFLYAIDLPTYKVFSLSNGRGCIQTTGLVLLNGLVYRQSFPVNCDVDDHLVYSPMDREWPQVLVLGVEYYRFLPLVSVSMVHKKVEIPSDMPVLNGDQIFGSVQQHTHYQERMSIQTIKYGTGTYLNLKTGMCTKVITDHDGRATKKTVSTCPEAMSPQSIADYNISSGELQ